MEALRTTGKGGSGWGHVMGKCREAFRQEGEAVEEWPQRGLRGSGEAAIRPMDGTFPPEVKGM